MHKKLLGAVCILLAAAAILVLALAAAPLTTPDNKTAAPVCNPLTGTEIPGKTADKIIPATTVFDRVYDLGTLTTDSEETILDLFWDATGDRTETKTATDSFGCSMIAKKCGDAAIVARNMDALYSNRPAYIYHTAVPGQYKTLGLTYTTHYHLPDYHELESAGGLDEDTASFISFICTDSINEAGLYIGENMRVAEYETVDGITVNKFANTADNPDKTKRVPIKLLPAILTRHCANVQEALDYIEKELDIYTRTGTDFDSYGYGFILADAGGRYGLLEIASDKISWIEGGDCQTNFYVTEEFAAKEEYKIGLGRYAYLKEHLPACTTENDLLNLIKQVAYTHVYSENCSFDNYSEQVHDRIEWTNAYVDTHHDEIEEIQKSDTALFQEQFSSEDISGDEIREILQNNDIWLSVFTLTANPSEKTLKVRFYEDENAVTTLAV
ncbi:MAG TPA: hypothetical protein O0X70_07740 [Methanocorpusculum sp.]|nr:hypothetical protein [Methanocorpusculum sp.]